MKVDEIGSKSIEKRAERLRDSLVPIGPFEPIQIAKSPIDPDGRQETLPILPEFVFATPFVRNAVEHADFVSS